MRRPPATGAIRCYLAKHKAEFDPRKYNSEAIIAMRSICEARYIEFGAAEQVNKIKPLMLEQMATRYSKGEFAVRTS